MKLSRLQVSNFRGIKKATLLFPNHVVLIGDNNTGKSTVLEAIDLVLGPDRLSRRSPIDEHDFHIGRYLPPDPTSLKQRHRASHRRIRQIPPQNKLRTRATPLRTVMKTTACLQGRHRPVGFFEARRAYDDAHALRTACRPVDIEANVESQVDDAASRWRPVALPGEPKWRALDGRIPLPCGTPRGVSGRSDRVWTRKIPLIVIVPQPRNGTLVRCCIKRSGPSDSLRTMYMKVESNERPPQ